MEEKGIQIALDPKLSIQLRHTVLEEVNISMNKQQELRVNSKTKEYPTWDMVGAIMDRIDDTVDYLNHLKLNIGKYPSFQLFHDLVTMFNISVDEYFYPAKNVEKNTARRQIDSSLDLLSDNELKIIQGTIDGILNSRENKK